MYLANCCSKKSNFTMEYVAKIVTFTGVLVSYKSFSTKVDYISGLPHGVS